MRRFLLPVALATVFSGFSGRALAAPASLIVDDFESGVAEWTRSDKARVGLSDIVPTKSGAASVAGGAKSQGAALLAFKSGQKTWASLSRSVDGAAWAKIGGTRLSFQMSGGGNATGVILQLRAKNAGSDLTFSLPKPVRLDLTKWRRVVIPFSDFKGPKGEPLVFKGPKGEPLAPRLSTVYLLQFQQSGSWDSRFFSIDDITVEGSGIPIVATVPKAAPPKVDATTETASPSANQTAGAIKIGADYLRVAGAIRASANVSLGASYAGPGASPLETSKEFRSAVGLLKPKFVRLDVGALADLSDSSRPSFDFARLVGAARRARTLGAEPLIALSNPAEWGLDARAYSVLCADTARAVRAPGGGVSARFFELCPGGDDIDNRTALTYYNAGYDALKTLSKTLRVGGYGAPAGNLAAQTAFLQGARGLDFLSVASFGAGSGAPSEALLLSGARDVSALKTAAGALDKSRFPRAALFVTQANLSGARNAGESVPSDIRLVQGVSGAWWAEFMASGSRLADQIFHNDAGNAEWGLLNPDGPRGSDGQIQMAYPAYYSLWLWNTFFPSGSQRVATTSSDPAIFVAAANTSTAHNMLLVNTSSQPQTAQIAIRGFPVLREARLRLFDDPQQSVRFTSLPKSPFQTVKLEPFAVAVIQFIEPPKR